MKALVLAPMTEEPLARLKEMMPVTYESWADTRQLADPEELAQRIQTEGISVLVIEADFLPEELFQQAGNLRLVAICRNNLSHVDLEAATAHGVAASCLRVVLRGFFRKLLVIVIMNYSG